METDEATGATAKDLRTKFVESSKKAAWNSAAAAAYGTRLAGATLYEAGEKAWKDRKERLKREKLEKEQEKLEKEQ